MRRLLPDVALDLDLDGLLEAYAYPAGGRWVRTNMVATVDGAATGPDGRSGSISTPADRRVFSVLRGLADVILVGAGTVRVEGYGAPRAKAELAAWRAARDQAAAPVLAVVSRSLDLDPASPMFGDASHPAVILTVDEVDAERRRRLEKVADVVAVGETDVDGARALRALADRGLRRVLCEGGPTLLAQLLQEDLLDELCLTVSPLLTGGPAGRTLITKALDPPVGLTLTGLLEEDGTLFTRYLRAR